MFPPSTHPDSGETVAWEGAREPSPVGAADLLLAVERVAAAAALGKAWPAGGRHEAQLALAGALLTAKWTDDEAVVFLRAVCRVAGDEDAEKRAATVRSTRSKSTRANPPQDGLGSARPSTPRSCGTLDIGSRSRAGAPCGGSRPTSCR